MVALSDLTFLARTVAGGIRNVAGNTITVALATLAEGLYKVGNIDIDAKGVGSTQTVIRNSTSGQVTNLSVDGGIDAGSAMSLKNNGSTQYIKLTGTPTAQRTVTLPDVSGDALVRNSADGVVTIAADTLFNVPDALADSSAGFCNQETGQACNLIVDGTVQFKTDLSNGNAFKLTGTPTALRTITFPDASGTVAFAGSSANLPVDSKVNIQALTPSAPVIYYCNNIVGASGGGVMGALVYYNTVTGLWLRVSDDNPF